ncbi:MAG: oligoendopeptidase F [Nitrospinota bacterium]|nr:oligoendopeptidase F [Nitrospinota bacterium]
METLTNTGIIQRHEMPEEAKWDLTCLYATDQDWQDHFEALQTEAANYQNFKRTLGRSAGSLKNFLEFDAGISRKLDSLSTYAHLKNDEDKTNSVYQGNFDRTMSLVARVSEARSFFAAELMLIPEGQMNAFLETEELKFFRFYLEQTLRFRRHTLSDKEEALLASPQEMARAPQEGFGMLDNADLKLGTIKNKAGEDIQLTHGNFQSLLQNYNRDIRKAAAERFYAEYGDHQHTYASLLASSIKNDLFYAKARGYPSAREKALFSDNISVDVYDNLVKTVRQNLEPLYKYFSLRKRILGLDELHFYDCSVPLAKNIHWHVGYPEAVGKIQSALLPLGGDYTNVLTQGLLSGRWVDRFENKGKRSGAYSSGCYDSAPYILMNYREDNINSIYTLAHEAGHSMHSYYSRKTQSYLYSDYTIFVAEVASTFNEALLTRYFLAQDLDKEMKIYLVCREIDNFRGTLYRQTMFAEFEHQIHAMAENGEPLTLDSLRLTYKDLLEVYFGSEVILDDFLDLECFRIPHFYFSFYVYKYATGISAAYSLSDRVVNGGHAELEDYLNFLHAGGTQYPLELLKNAGVDMTSPEPIEHATQKFSQLVDQLESLTKE